MGNWDWTGVALAMGLLANAVATLVVFGRIVTKVAEIEAKINIMYSWFKRQIDAQNGG